MSIRLKQLVERLGGQLIGNPELIVSGIAPLDTAGPDHITFLSNSKLRIRAAQTHAAALILSPDDHVAIGSSYSGTQIVCDNPYAYFARSAQWFTAAQALSVIPGIHPSAVIDPTAQIASSACIGPHVVIEAGVIVGVDAVIDAGCFIGRNARVGAATHLFARVVLHAGCVVGARGILYSGAVIGTDGFGFANDRGVWIKIPQAGAVVMGDDVEIGANTTVDRGTLSDTIIGDGVKLDNQIQIGHNCQIGAHTAMAGCVGVAGSAVIGKYCTFGGAAMVHGHLTIVDHVDISGGSMVSRSIREPGQYSGYYPLAKNADWEKSAPVIRHLADLRKRIRELEKMIKTLTKKNDE